MMTAKDRLLWLERNTPAGWLDGDGVPVTQAALAAARRWLVWLPRGGIFPQPEGGIQAEWSVHGWALELSFDPRGRATFIATDCRR